MHAAQIQGFFDIPVDNLYASPIFAIDIRHNFANHKNITIVSPDVGGVSRARELAEKILDAKGVLKKITKEADLDESKEKAGSDDGRSPDTKKPFKNWEEEKLRVCQFRPYISAHVGDIEQEDMMWCHSHLFRLERAIMSNVLQHEFPYRTPRHCIDADLGKDRIELCIRTE